MKDTETCISVRRTATYEDLEVEAARLTQQDLQSVLSAHPDQLNRIHLGFISEEGFRFHCLFQRRAQLLALCTNSPEQAQERERLWLEMTKIKTLLNGYLQTEIKGFNEHPMDLVFIDSNREVYALFGRWELVAEEAPVVLAPVDRVIENYGIGEPL